MRITRITLNSFLVSLLGILTAEVGFSDGTQNGSYDDCNNSREGICYLLASNGEPNWNTAHDKCQAKNSYLPIIRNQEQQTTFEAYLQHLNSKALRINYVWTSGKRKLYNDWTWTNGQTLSNAFTISNDYSAMETHMTLTWPITGKNFILKPVNSLDPTWYLCQYKDHQCNGQHEVNGTNGCLIPSGYGNASWYEARNECLSTGGDLAILTDQDLQILKMHKFPNDQYQYWIGLRIINWVWITTNISKATSSREEEVKYTKWSRQPMPTDGGELCISIATNDGQWRASTCNNSVLSVVCEKRGNIKPSTKISSTVRRSTKIITMISSTIEKSTEDTTTTQKTASKSPSTAATTTRRSPITTAMNKHNVISSASLSAPTKIYPTSGTSTTAVNLSSTAAYAAIGAGVVIVILCIVVILVVILCRKSRSSNNKTEPAAIDLETKDKKTKASPSTTTTATTTEERSIYADIPLAEKTANDDDTVEANQKPTVYASLDFDQGGVTYAEPSKLYTNTQKNVSSLIYAEPLNGGTGNQKGATSVGSSPAVKIGPMGDVYALPKTNVTPSSSDKTTERAIYANT